jgi:hypothetical protein
MSPMSKYARSMVGVDTACQPMKTLKPNSKELPPCSEHFLSVAINEKAIAELPED